MSGKRAKKVDPADLVGQFEIAERLGMKASHVRVWRTRGRLPEPVAELSMGPIYSWPEVEAMVSTE